MHVVPTDDSDEPAAPRDAARYGRDAAMQRRRQASKGKQALKGNGDRTADADTRPPNLIVHPGGAG
jgi:hypothetical protein